MASRTCCKGAETPVVDTIFFAMGETLKTAEAFLITSTDKLWAGRETYWKETGKLLAKARLCNCFVFFLISKSEECLLFRNESTNSIEQP